jgi:hypothetical protein
MRPITDVLRDIRRSGELTITIKVKPDKDGGTGKMLSCSVKCKKPVSDIPEAIFFSDPHGDLHRTDPAQSEMFTEAPRPAGDINQLGRGPSALAARAG